MVQLRVTVSSKACTHLLVSSLASTAHSNPPPPSPSPLSLPLSIQVALPSPFLWMTLLVGRTAWRWRPSSKAQLSQISPFAIVSVLVVLFRVLVGGPHWWTWYRPSPPPPPLPLHLSPCSETMYRLYSKYVRRQSILLISSSNISCYCVMLHAHLPLLLCDALSTVQEQCMTGRMWSSFGQRTVT